MRKTGLILGKIGSGLGLVAPIFLLVLLVGSCTDGIYMSFGMCAFLGGFSLIDLLSNFGLHSSAILGVLIVSQLIFVLLGILGIVYDRKNSKTGGILLIVAGIGFALASGLDYLVATPLLLAAGILLLLQK
jgi:hypothetical protein